MNHQKIYDLIIQKARLENRIKLKKIDPKYIYYEEHHIIPRCLGGRKNKDNLVLLTAREHFVCHKLLTYIYKGNYKIISAFNLMTFMNKRKYGVSSRDYKYARELYIFTPIDEETLKKKRNIIHTKEWNEKISKALKKHLVLDKTKQKISASNLGRIYGEEARKNYKKGNKNKNLGVKHSKKSIEQTMKKIRGIKRSDEFKKNVSIGAFNSRKECEFCHKSIPLNIYNRCHGEKCNKI
jgi:hypothetical protein